MNFFQFNLNNFHGDGKLDAVPRAGGVALVSMKYGCVDTELSASMLHLSKKNVKNYISIILSLWFPFSNLVKRWSYVLL